MGFESRSAVSKAVFISSARLPVWIIGDLLLGLGPPPEGSPWDISSYFKGPFSPGGGYHLHTRYSWQLETKMV